MATLATPLTALRPATDYYVSSSVLASLSSRTKLTANRLRALAITTSMHSAFPNGKVLAEVSLKRLDVAGVRYTPTQSAFKDGHRQAYTELFEPLFKTHPLETMNATRFSSFRIKGANYANCGTSTPTTFLTAMNTSLSTQFTAYMSYVTHLGLLPLLVSGDFATFAQRYAELNDMQGLTGDLNRWVRRFPLTMKAQNA